MRDFSKVSPTVWRSKKYRSLSSFEARHVYLYLLTCPHGNSAGCFDLHPMYACADIGMDEERYRYCIGMLCEAGLIEWDEAENTVLIGNWMEFNAPANFKHALGILSQLDQASSAALKIKAFQELLAVITAKKFDREASIRNAMQSFRERYGYGITTETRDRDETERETKTETRPDETETREEISRAPRPVAALSGDGPAAKARDRPPPNVSPLLQTKLMRGSA